MPLPPAPTKRAALLPPEAYDAPARSSHKAARKTEATPATARCAEKPQALDFDPRAGRRRRAPRSASATTSRPTLEQAAAGGAARSDVQPSPAPRPREEAKATGPAKLFVLDTNVLMHDPMSLFRFEEHDIFLPMIVLEELDGHKKGTTEVARNARQASRSLDALAGAQGADIASGLKLDTTGHREAGGCLFFQTQTLANHLPTSLPQGKADNQILGVVQALREQHAPREVVLVSKDINMRVKARALGLATDDYQNDKTLDDLDLMYSGALALPPDFWAKHGKTVESWQSGQHTFYRISGPGRAQPADQPVRVLRVARRAQPVCARDRDPRQDRGAQDAEGLRPPEELRLGRDHAQPRAELRDEPADGPGGGLRHAHRHGRHRQDADGAGLRA